MPPPTIGEALDVQGVVFVEPSRSSICIRWDCEHRSKEEVLNAAICSNLQT
ncbi:hypothetical protein FHS92_001232 [Sphingobium subterraneum]|uniref:Uncharacterized protein n=1 Tax=Sphingobium subterraneum TaxID=627688 RepID=A0A841J4M4_9SPHN|nr:hypothetical protein [Sphingobium subterraneum]